MQHIVCRILAGLMLVFAALPALAIEFVYPGDKSVVSRSDFLILRAGANPPVEALVVDLGGVKSDPIDISSAEYKAAFGDLLILEPQWDKGLNTVKVEALAGGKVVGKGQIEFYYSPLDEPAAIVPKGFVPFVMHTPEKEKACAPCHNMNPNAAQLKGATAKDNPCGSCHQRMLNAKFVHGPEGVFQCVDCHSDGKKQRWTINKPILTLCGECHTDKIDEFKKNAFVHGPVAVGDCIICHDPHASNQPAQLVAAINPLCLGCHSSVAKSQHVTRGVGGKAHPLDKVKDPLNPGKELSCASCHNPHGGASSAFFRQGTAGKFALCLLCHKK